jgi:hypothetical protein
MYTSVRNSCEVLAEIKLKIRHFISSLLSVRAVETNHVGEVFAGTADDISNFLGSWGYVHIGTVGKQASLKKILRRPTC